MIKIISSNVIKTKSLLCHHEGPHIKKRSQIKLLYIEVHNIIIYTNHVLTCAPLQSWWESARSHVKHVLIPVCGIATVKKKFSNNT